MRRLVAIATACVLVVPAVSFAGRRDRDDHREANAKLQVGTRVAPPFAMKDADGGWHGISIDLWRAVASDLGVEFEFQERASLEDLLHDTAAGELDAAVAALTVTSRREKLLDFTHPFYATGSAIVVSAGDGSGGWGRVVGRLVSGPFLLVVGMLAGLLMSAGAVVWMFERHSNAEMFDRAAGPGLGNAFWWAAVTMTTVGYGDMAPKTVGGRLVALVWMFASIIVISSFTASITASLTLEELSGKVRGLADLPNVRVGAVADSSSADFLARRGIAAIPIERSSDGLEAVAEQGIDAFVHDRPILEYQVRRQFRGELSVLPETFAPQYYAIGLPRRSALRERLNRALLSHTDSDAWPQLLERYLGRRT